MRTQKFRCCREGGTNADRSTENFSMLIRTRWTHKGHSSRKKLPALFLSPIPPSLIFSWHGKMIPQSRNIFSMSSVRPFFFTIFDGFHPQVHTGSASSASCIARRWPDTKDKHTLFIWLTVLCPAPQSPHHRAVPHRIRPPTRQLQRLCQRTLQCACYCQLLVPHRHD